ncbi:hypothetical protein NMG60_11015691 [Bertholletia excelsa]
MNPRPTRERRDGLSRVFSEDFHMVKLLVLDPRGRVVRCWHELLLVAAVASLFVDPLFLFLPAVRRREVCVETAPSHLHLVLTTVRSVIDMFYVLNVVFQFRTAYVAPSSRVVGRGELVVDSSEIAHRYLRRRFWVDLLASLPFPQIMTWVIIPTMARSGISRSRIVLRFIPISQFLLRLYLLYPLSWKIIKDTGKMTETAWVGAAYNLMLYYVASNISGACWYLLTLERQEACWKSVCDIEKQSCSYGFFDCRTVGDPGRTAWFATSNVTNLCDPSNKYYGYGVYGLALLNNAPSEVFIRKHLFSFYWGLQSLTSIGNNLSTTGYVGENVFVNLVASLGLFLLAGLLGNMQRYLQSTSARLEEWRQKRNDIEQWMHHRKIPPELCQSVRKYDQYKWVATRGVDEKTILNSLPKDLQRRINHHLFYNLIRQVPLFDQMDDLMLDKICERLKPAMYIGGTFLVREGDPVKEMAFIIRGHLESYTTGGGREGFFTSSQMLGPGSFCGQELLAWALDRPSGYLPSSTCTVKSISNVEAFTLEAEDLKTVALQLTKFHSRQLRHKFRYYSQQWRNWAACYIQEAWRRYTKRHEADEMGIFMPQPGLDWKCMQPG